MHAVDAKQQDMPHRMLSWSRSVVVRVLRICSEWTQERHCAHQSNPQKKRAVRIEFFYFRLATVYLSTSKYSLRLLVESTDPQTRERAVKLAEDLRRLFSNKSCLFSFFS